MTIKTLIVDDEPLARKNIELMLESEPDIMISHSCGRSREALRLIREEPPDLVFLDIKMPGMSGLEILDALFAETGYRDLPYFIFVTAFDHYAVQAFERHALDYLVKPFSEARFRKSLSYARERINDRGGQPLKAFLARYRAASNRVASPACLVLEESGKMTILDHEDIHYIEVANHYLLIHTSDEQHIVRRTMKEMEVLLGNGFFRVHRSTLVNLRRIRHIGPAMLGESKLTLCGGQTLAVSRRKCRELKEKLKEISPSPH